MRAVLGIDTSCYTTSAALVSEDGEILASARQLLAVAEGERGLQQSQGLFQHVKSLPQMIERVMADVPEAGICAVSASVRPRPAERSYMPVFRAGESQARAAAALLRVPFYPVSHQEGHVRAAMVDSGIEPEAPFLALHLSGGTTEVLLADSGKLTLLGGSLDLHAGQLIDRTGVRMGLPFPAGPSLERLAMKGEAKGLLGVSIKGIGCNLAGAENKTARWLE
ncbi:MAG: O-sialoglycoprotein endopeptidase, partial [Clostridia bacterium]|nr:O-sialoglycoprotein endopeptidase [Clostridia bacterium]